MKKIQKESRRSVTEEISFTIKNKNNHWWFMEGFYACIKTINKMMTKLRVKGEVDILDEGKNKYFVELYVEKSK